MAVSSTNTDNHESIIGATVEVFVKYEGFIRTVIHHQVKNKSQADELFQDFFLSFASKALPPSIRNTKSYLYRSVNNHIIISINRMKSRQHHIQKYIECHKYNIIQEDPENIAIRIDEAEKMLQKIELRLCKHEAEVIVQRYVYNRSTAETAEKMHVNKRTISRYLSLALKKIRQFIPQKEMIYDDLP